MQKQYGEIMFSKDTFCILPWSSIQINPNGDYKVCCFSGAGNGGDHGLAFDENNRVMNVMTHSILEAMNSRYHKEVRLAQSENIRHPICKVCWDRDDANSAKGQETTSLRSNRSFKQLPHLDNAITLERAPIYLVKDGSLNEYPISLDLRFSNQCNMKCIMCSSLYSSMWVEDEIKLHGRSIAIEKEPWHDSPKWWDQFDMIKHRVRHIYLTGGEPFVVKGHDTLLNKLIDGGYAKDVVLEYDTNLSVINNKILDKFSHFNKIVLSVSCDDIEDQYEHIRFPGKWETMLTNLQKLKDKNIQIRHLSSCVGIYSIYSPIRLYNYFSKLGYDTYSFRMLRAPAHFDVAFLPDHMKKEIINTYNDSNLPEKWKNFVCGYLENNMDKYGEVGSFHISNFVKYMNQLDEIRNTDWKKTFPDVVKLLDI
jgi:organic radical activating enzyme